MDGLNYENFEDLALEHRTMLGFLEGPGASLTSPAWLQFERLLGSIHHHKEEAFLFPLLLGSSRLEVGGPKCMTFFTPRVIGGTGWEDSFAKAKRLHAGSEGILPEERSPFRDRVFGGGSMLKIPLEDHILGARLIEQLKVEKDLIQQDELFRAFKDLLADHIQREDECLLELFREALSPAQKKSYAEKASAFDKASGTDHLLRGLASR